jgi:hypothetical protein
VLVNGRHLIAMRCLYLSVCVSVCVALVASDACLLRLQASVAASFDGAGHVRRWEDSRGVFGFEPLQAGVGGPLSLERSHE